MVNKVYQAIAMTFRIIRGFVNVNFDRIFSITDCETSHTRDHNVKVFKDHCNMNVAVTLWSVIKSMFGTANVAESDQSINQNLFSEQ